VRGILIDRDDMIAEMHFLEEVCIPFLDRLPTVDWSSVGHINRILREAGGGIIIVRRVAVLFNDRTSRWRSCESGLFVCWAKVGKAKPIANPTVVINKRIFIISSREFRTVCRRTICCGIFSRRE
jgi:hypothetical protein